MARETKAADDLTAAELVEGIVTDFRDLLGEHFDLLRQEVREEIDRGKAALVSLGAGAGLLALGGVLSAHMAAHLAHRAARLPLWASYGLVGGLLGGAGWALLARARRQAAGVRLGLPPQTTAALQEDLTWLQEQKEASPA